MSNSLYTLCSFVANVSDGATRFSTFVQFYYKSKFDFLIKNDFPAQYITSLGVYEKELELKLEFMAASFNALH